jgi:hypothetical protein
MQENTVTEICVQDTALLTQGYMFLCLFGVQVRNKPGSQVFAVVFTSQLRLDDRLPAEGSVAPCAFNMPPRLAGVEGFLLSV